MNDKQDISTLIQLLQHRAAHQPDQPAYTLLPESGRGESALTYHQLDREARLIGARLQRLNAAGERVLLLYPTAIEYITSFFGCLYAGAVPVPVYPPRRLRPDSRIQAIALDAQAAIALTKATALPIVGQYVQQSPDLKGLRCLGISYPELGNDADLWQEPAASGDSLAYIQYTSGSTASPKGVMLSHSNILHLLAQLQQVFKIGRGDTGVSWLPLYHDMGLVGCVLMSLYAGIPLVLLSPADFAQNPVRWLQAITDQQATLSGAPSFAYQLCIDRITPDERATLDLGSWRVAFCGSEPIRAEMLDRFTATFADAGFRPEAFCPCYGLVESTMAVSAKATATQPVVYTVQRSALERGQVIKHIGQEQPGQEVVSCGPGLPGQQLVVVDPESLAPCPPDRVGEIWVSSSWVGQGYWNRPEETARIFHALLAGTGSGPFLRTGDLGFLQDGQLFIAGRLKDIIIFRGLNYDPHDIESTARRSHPALQPDGCAALSIPLDGEERLVLVHELRRSQRKANAVEIARAIRQAVAQEQELPVYAVALVKPGAIPRTSSGKVQRYLCRAEFMAGRLDTIAVSLLDKTQHAEPFDPDRFIVAPRTPMEMALAHIWADVLDLERIGIEDNFFELGGNSLLATQAVSRVREMFEIDIPLRAMFETPTVLELAAQVERALTQRPALRVPPLEPAGRDGPLPLSFAQERMWFLHHLDPESSAYNIPGALRLVGPLDRKALEQSLHEIVARHEAFRTTFATVDGQPVQVISPLPEPALEVVDLRRFPRPDRESRAMQRIQDEARRPFDLQRGPLLRVTLLEMAGEEHILLFNMHHIVSDAWSLGLLAGEVLNLYNSYAAGETPSLPHLPIEYADFAVWQRQWLQGKALEVLLAYWRKQLAGVPVLELPTDLPRPAMLSYRGAVMSGDLSQDLLAGLKRLSNREEVTLFMTLLAAFQILLHRYTGLEDIAIGVPIANRNWHAVEGVVGSFVNTLLLRTDLGGNPTLREALRRARETALGAYTYQDMPYAKLVAELQPERDTSRAPLAQVMFNVINVTMPRLQLKDLLATPIEVDRSGAQFDLTLTVADNDFMPQIWLEYSTDLFTADTAGRMLGHFRNLLVAIVTDPSQRISSLPMLTDADRRQLLLAWNDTRASYPEDATFAQLFEAQVQRTPDAAAFLFDGQELAYGELNLRANQVAHYLRSLGVGPEVMVGVFLEPSLELPVALLGILKAGGAYLPLDPAYPAERLAFMVRDAGAPVLVTLASLAARLPQHEARVVCLDADRGIIDGQATSNPSSGTDADSLAYVLYTSGSTGTPKGVCAPYRGACNRFAWMWSAYPFAPGEVCCQKTSVSFVDSVWEIFGPLLQGIPTLILPDCVVRDPQQLVKSLAANRVTRIALVPSLLKAILDTHADLRQRLPDLRFWVCSSETLPVELVMRFREAVPQGTLVNLYGCSEVAADVTCYDTALLGVDSPSTPIGRPIANTTIYLLDSQSRPVPIGVPGEIHVGGANLARGYLNKPQLTRERFVPDPFAAEPAARLYRTGDLGRYRPDGNIEYLGRRDHQVKIRGFRIELGEVEAVLRQHPAVAQAVVTVPEQGRDASSSLAGTDQRLAAYLVPKAGMALSVPDLRAFLGTKLPAHMIPSAFVFLDALPLNPHGKIDRHALARLPGTGSQDRAELGLPGDEIERRLVSLWEEVVGITPIGIRDNFFDLGGHSLLAIRLFARIKEELGAELPIASLFQAPTIEQLAETIRQAGSVPAWSPLVPLQPQGSRPPFYCVHGLGGGVWGYAELAGLLGPEQPLYGLQARGLEGGEPPHTRIEDMAAAYVNELRRVQPQGPYRLGGYSSGGVVAFEMARLLQAQGEQVALLALFDSYAPLVPGARRRRWPVLIGFLRNLPRWLADFRRREDRDRRLLARFRGAAQAIWRGRRSRDSLPAEVMILNAFGDAAQISDERRRLVEAHLRALQAYRPQVYPGRVTLYRVRGMRLFRAEDASLGWEALASGGVEVRMISGAHYDILQPPAVAALAEELKASLAQVV